MLAHDPRYTMTLIKSLALCQEGKARLFIGLMCPSQACDLRFASVSMDAVSIPSKAPYGPAQRLNAAPLMTAY